MFNSENYPVMAKLTREEKEFFAIKHGLLHMQKSILMIVDAVHFRWDIRTCEDYKKAVLKMVVNMISVSGIVQLTTHEIEQLDLRESTLTLSDVLLKMMKDLATQCEAYDHHQDSQRISVIEQLKIKESLKIAWAELLFLFKNQFQQEFLLKDFLAEIPSVMRSK